ncbi:hypothetical protein SMB34_18145 [Thalassospira permensis NBRC 106175]|uniref:Uncharacterized protein n=2 Tax=Thalassospira permensis TaxID=680197 RepID=A0ABR4TNG1_9PROT|nr:hypothetical protein SMB34_18145 [Thalassospira permensis NBRC 106175]
MNPTLYKALIMLASKSKPASATKPAGRDGGLGNRTVLYADEPVDLPDWGIAALPSMILGAAPQSCLFVSDLTVEEPDDETESSAGTPGNADTTPPVKVSFSLTVDSAPGDNSQLIQRQITWRLAMPVRTFRQITTSANSTPVRAPVIRTKLVLRNVVCDVELGLLEVPGITQPLLVGRDTLSDRFLIRPDHDKAAPTPSPSATLSITPDEPAAPAKPVDPASTTAPATPAEPGKAPDTSNAAPQSAASSPNMPPVPVPPESEAASATTPTPTPTPAPDAPVPTADQGTAPTADISGSTTAVPDGTNGNTAPATQPPPATPSTDQGGDASAASQPVEADKATSTTPA